MQLQTENSQEAGREKKTSIMALGVKKKLAWLDVGKMEIMEVFT